MRLILLTAALAATAASLFIIDASSAHTLRPVPAAATARMHQPRLLTRPMLPAPPTKIGSYHYHLGINETAGWRKIRNDTRAFVQQHFPHVQVLSGINPIFDKGAAPISVSVTEAYPLLGPGTDTDNRYGFGAHSIQNNVFFYGNNGQLDADQFTDQILSDGSQAACVTQVVVSTQNYNIQCSSVNFNPVALVEGWVDGGTIGVAVATRSGSTAVAVVTSDVYGLGSYDRWNNSSGSILGLGDGSEAVFGDRTEEAIGVEVGGCPDYAGFIKFSIACGPDKLNGVTYTGYSPGKPAGVSTQETNNLVPVIGEPPTDLPAQEYFGDTIAQISYTATMSGHCLAGVPPYC